MQPLIFLGTPTSAADRASRIAHRFSSTLTRVALYRIPQLENLNEDDSIRRVRYELETFKQTREPAIIEMYIPERSAGLFYRQCTDTSYYVARTKKDANDSCFSPTIPIVPACDFYWRIQNITMDWFLRHVEKNLK